METNCLKLGADVRMDLARILLVAGRREGDLPLISEAIDLYCRKGNLVSAAWASALGEAFGSLA